MRLRLVSPVIGARAGGGEGESLDRSIQSASFIGGTGGVSTPLLLVSSGSARVTRKSDCPCNPKWITIRPLLSLCLMEEDLKLRAMCCQLSRRMGAQSPRTYVYFGVCTLTEEGSAEYPYQLLVNPCCDTNRKGNRFIEGGQDRSSPINENGRCGLWGEGERERERERGGGREREREILTKSTNTSEGGGAQGRSAHQLPQKVQGIADGAL